MNEKQGRLCENISAFCILEENDDKGGEVIDDST